MPGLTKKEVKEIREELDNCTNPLFFFHDDADGLCSFLQLYKYKGEGHGTVIKRSQLQAMMFRKVEEYRPDKIFVVDISSIEEDFANACNVPIIWIDHHKPAEIDGIKYYNPRRNNPDDGTPVSYLCHQVVKQSIWLPMAGCVGDWFLPDFTKEFSDKYPDLLPASINKPDDALFATEIGLFVKIMGFVLKGKITDVNTAVKILSRIKDPYEILEKKTPQAKLIYKMFERVNTKYEALKNRSKEVKEDNGFVIFKYDNNDMSFTKDLSNEMLYENPDKIIFVARDNKDEVKMSVRASNYILPSIIEKALVGVTGYGGGHEHACGVVVKTRDYERFMENFKEEIRKDKK